MLNDINEALAVAWASVPPWGEYVNSLVTNQVFQGFFALSVLGACVYALKLLLYPLFRFLRAKLTVEVNVHNTDDSFEYLVLALGRYSNLHTKTRRLRAATSYVPSSSNEELLYYPADGRHLIRYRNLFLLVDKETSEAKGGRPPEKFTLRCMSRSPGALKKILEEGRELYQDLNNGKVKVAEWSDNWRSFYRLPRPLESVITEGSVKEDLVNDLQWFLDSQSWFSYTGVPYHRGYLLYGPPGTGKTSLVLALATYFDKPLFSANLATVTSDRGLVELLSDAPEDAIVLLEDVDSCPVVFARTKSLTTELSPREEEPIKDEEEDEESDVPSPTSSPFNKLTLSGLLNALDGVGSVDGRVVIMTSNTPYGFDSALTRPGRIDRHFYLGYPSEDTRAQIYCRFFPEASETEAREFARKWPGTSPAFLQGEMMKELQPKEVSNDAH